MVGGRGLVAVWGLLALAGCSAPLAVPLYAKGEYESRRGQGVANDRGIQHSKQDILQGAYVQCGQHHKFPYLVGLDGTGTPDDPLRPEFVCLNAEDWFARAGNLPQTRRPAALFPWF